MTAGSFLHIARDHTGVDVEAAERAAADFLAALGSPGPSPACTASRAST
jgi:hypothetical protein